MTITTALNHIILEYEDTIIKVGKETLHGTLSYNGLKSFRLYTDNQEKDVMFAISDIKEFTLNPNIITL